MRLLMLFCGMLFLSIGVVDAQRGQQDTWVNGGIGPGSQTDVQKFVRNTDAAFVGVLEEVSVKFLDDKQEWLFTSLRFRVSEWLYNNVKRDSDIVDVLTFGGSFSEREGQRVAKHPNEIADHVRVGAEYFVPVKYANDVTRAWNGRPLVAGLDALTELRDGQVLAVQPHSRWAEQILARTSTTQPTPGLAASDRLRLLTSIKSAGNAKR
jgi:hypothetical protein